MAQPQPHLERTDTGHIPGHNIGAYQGSVKMQGNDIWAFGVRDPVMHGRYILLTNNEIIWYKTLAELHPKDPKQNAHGVIVLHNATVTYEGDDYIYIVAPESTNRGIDTDHQYRFQVSSADELNIWKGKITRSMVRAEQPDVEEGRVPVRTRTPETASPTTGNDGNPLDVEEAVLDLETKAALDAYNDASTAGPFASTPTAATPTGDPPSPAANYAPPSSDWDVAPASPGVPPPPANQDQPQPQGHVQPPPAEGGPRVQSAPEPRAGFDRDSAGGVIAAKDLTANTEEQMAVLNDEYVGEEVKCECKLFYKCECNKIKTWCLVQNPGYFHCFCMIGGAFLFYASVDAIIYKGMSEVVFHPVNILIDLYLAAAGMILLIIESDFCRIFASSSCLSCFYCKTVDHMMQRWMRGCNQQGFRGASYVFLGGVCIAQHEAATWTMDFAGCYMMVLGVFLMCIARQVANDVSIMAAKANARINEHHGGNLDALWEEFDTDGTGKITIRQFQALCNKLGWPLQRGELTAALRSLDMDSSGDIDKDEFAVWISNRG